MVKLQEMERKFLIKEPSKKLLDWFEYVDTIKIDQYYILIEDNKEMRVRREIHKDDIQYLMTIKEGKGSIRQEVQFNISKAMYEYQREKAIGYVGKERMKYGIYGDLVADIDFFNGFIMVEVEFDNGWEYMEFDKEILEDLSKTRKVKEVTCNPEYYNSYIATHKGG
jgi:CYTH domain-containing protein